MLCGKVQGAAFHLDNFTLLFLVLYFSFQRRPWGRNEEAEGGCRLGSFQGNMYLKINPLYIWALFWQGGGVGWGGVGSGGEWVSVRDWAIVTASFEWTLTGDRLKNASCLHLPPRLWSQPKFSFVFRCVRGGAPRLRVSVPDWGFNGRLPLKPVQNHFFYLPRAGRETLCFLFWL